MTRDILNIQTAGRAWPDLARFSSSLGKSGGGDIVVSHGGASLDAYDLNPVAQRPQPTI